ncbi:hypothetical protein [Nakamurella aerolata]|uniref:Uncharacterized protein n=1 Tax=Nakamurella aerolata TaxID=1656892 RepID=A0A849AJC4_9ACTN|nr:hypothetical protein [Nakamurella aerolata]NNG36912.1 hypothetical protein [Nakamurella aerolata]
MSTNTFPRPIDPSEIREGDLIRAEHGDQAREDRVRFVGERPLSSGGVIGDLFLSGHGDAKRIAELSPVVERTWQDAIDALRTAAAGFPSGTRGRADMREVADYLESLAASRPSPTWPRRVT